MHVFKIWILNDCRATLENVNVVGKKKNIFERNDSKSFFKSRLCSGIWSFFKILALLLLMVFGINFTLAQASVTHIFEWIRSPNFKITAFLLHFKR